MIAGLRYPDKRSAPTNRNERDTRRVVRGARHSRRLSAVPEARAWHSKRKRAKRPGCSARRGDESFESRPQVKEQNNERSDWQKPRGTRRQGCCEEIKRISGNLHFPTALSRAVRQICHDTFASTVLRFPRDSEIK